MAKNKKKSVSKVIVSRPISNDTDGDESNAISEQVIVLASSDNLESTKQTKQVEHTEQHFDNKLTQDIMDITNIDNKTIDNIVEIQINKTEPYISPPLDNLNSDDLSVEYNIISLDEQNS
jgi:hypothetical protein